MTRPDQTRPDSRQFKIVDKGMELNFLTKRAGAGAWGGEGKNKEKQFVEQGQVGKSKASTNIDIQQLLAGPPGHSSHKALFSVVIPSQCSNPTQKLKVGVVKINFISWQRGRFG